MSLMTCNECGQNISAKAVSYPRCGSPRRRRFLAPIGLLARILWLLLGAYLLFKVVLPVLDQAFQGVTRIR